MKNVLDFTIRPYEPVDALHLGSLYFESARSLGVRRYSPEQVEAWAPEPASSATVHDRATDGRLTLVACGPDGVPLAYGDLKPNGHIDHLYAHPKASGRGVATALLNCLIQAAEERGIAQLRVEASELARGLFERAGFSVVQRRDFVIKGVAIHNFAMKRHV